MSATYPSLNGRRVLVTGGASGIGAAMVRAFAGQGCSTAFLDIDDAAAAGLAGVATYRRCDLRDIEDLRAAIADLGPFDVLVNNAASDERHDLFAVEPDYWRERMALNLDHQFFASQAAAREMVVRKWGVILLLGSVSWLRGRPGMAGYTSAKAAVHGLVKTLARELGPSNVRVVGLIPGAVRTERQARLWRTPEADAAFLDAQALKFHLNENHVADAALFLASDGAAAITGQSLIVDGGLT